jgi:MFS family permease
LEKDVAVETRRLSIGLMMNVSVIAFEALAVATIAPQTARDLGGVDLYGWLFSAFMLANLLSVVVAGHAADHQGPAPVFLGGLALFTAGLLACGLAPTMPLLVVGRAIQGLGAGALSAVAYVAIGRAFGEAERPRQLALLSTAWVVPGLIAPGVAGVIAEQLSWRVVFLGLLGLPLVAAWLCLPPLRAITPGGVGPEHALPVGAAVRLALGAGLVVTGLGADDWILGIPLLVLGCAVAAPAFIRLTPAGTLRAARGLPAAIATRGLQTFAFFGTDAFFALALASVRHLSAVEVGLVLTPPTFTWTAGAWIQARRAGHWSRRVMVTAGLGFVALGVALCASVLVDGIPLAVSCAGWGFGGFGMGLAYSPISLVVLSEADDASQGAATASLNLTDVLGIALGTGIGGAIVAIAPSLDWTRRDALTAVFALMLAAALLGIAIARRLPRDPGTASDPGAAFDLASAPVEPAQRAKPPM